MKPPGTATPPHTRLGSNTRVGTREQVERLRSGHKPLKAISWVAAPSSLTGPAAQQNGKRTAALWRRGLATQTAAKSVRKRAHGTETVPSNGSRCATVDGPGAAAHARRRGGILGPWYRDSGCIASQCEGRACARGLHSPAHWCPRTSALATCREGEMCTRVSCCYHEQQRAPQAGRRRGQ